MKTNVFIITLIVSAASLHGQISGGLDLAPRSQASPKSQASASKEIAVTSFGASPEAAEKRAISDAVRQAVGAYIDAKTITENDAVIKDRILSVSSGFVKSYKVTSPAEKTEDGLYQISVMAVVETNQVAAALKEAKIISGEMDGKSLWAESSTKSLNAEDARRMLEEKLPEIYKSLLKIQLLDKEGNVSNSTSPLSRVENPRNNSVSLKWLVGVSTDHKYYMDSLLPLAIKCFEAISGSPAKKFSFKCFSGNQGVFDVIGLSENRGNSSSHSAFVVTNYSRSLDLIEGIFFKSLNRGFRLSTGNGGIGRNYAPIFIDVALKSTDGELIASERINPLEAQRDDYSSDAFLAPWFNYSYGGCQFFSPFYCKAAVLNGGNFLDALPNLRRLVSITVPIADLKDVSKVEFNLSVNDIKVQLLDGSAIPR